jgi:hypothetical protein
MCMFVFIAADRRLPLIEFDRRGPSIHVREIDEETEGSVRTFFSAPHVYYVGTHEKCSCGFSYGQEPEWEEEDQVEISRKCTGLLRQYVEQALNNVDRVELLACWSESVGQPPLRRYSGGPGIIGGDAFWFEDRDFYQLERVPA